MRMPRSGPIRGYGLECGHGSRAAAGPKAARSRFFRARGTWSIATAPSNPPGAPEDLRPEGVEEARLPTKPHVATARPIDLHTHSTASDGLLSPEDVVLRAADRGVAVVALTDHDTTAGIARAAAALPAGLTLLPGAEISCEVDVGDHRISLHVLAYLFDRAEPRFAAARARIRESRANRARRMVDRIVADGHPVTWNQVTELARGTVGRPHVAAALVKAGLLPDVAGAFTPEWIGTGGRYWVGKDEPDVWETLRLIRTAGGVSVFAHPFASSRGAIVPAYTVAEMAAAGLTGIEIDHPDHPPETRRRLRGLAAELGLVPTGSSDFHGASKPQDIGAESTSWDAYEALVAAASGARPITADGGWDA